VGPWRHAHLVGPLAILLLLAGCAGEEQAVGEIEGEGRARAEVEAGEHTQREAVLALAPAEHPPDRQILFGDLHVHTTYSIDAFLYALPVFGGEGVHPPSDACDFARYCSALDFFSINDHAEGLTPERWQATKRSIRACDERAGDAVNPDLVPFLGWEWTQVGRTPEDHYGHKNVILRGLAEDQVPTRPITSLTEADLARAPPDLVLDLAQRVLPEPYDDFVWWVGRLAQLENCPKGVPVRDLPADRRESAPTPAELFAKLDDWGLPALVVPHGLVWGIHAPPGARLDNQLEPGQHDPRRQKLLEVYSGHGNGEEYRPWLDRGPEEPAGRRGRSCARAAGTCPRPCARSGSRRRAGWRGRAGSPLRGSSRTLHPRPGSTATSAVTASSRRSRREPARARSTRWRSPARTTTVARSASASASWPRATTTTPARVAATSRCIGSA
jgi:hypothetical protein